jgi:hypothetical protein
VCKRRAETYIELIDHLHGLHHDPSVNPAAALPSQASQLATFPHRMICSRKTSHFQEGARRLGPAPHLTLRTTFASSAFWIEAYHDPSMLFAASIHTVFGIRVLHGYGGPIR